MRWPEFPRRLDTLIYSNVRQLEIVAMNVWFHVARGFSVVDSFSIYSESLHSNLMKTSNLQFHVFHKMSLAFPSSSIIFPACHAALRHAHNNSMNHTIKPEHFNYSNYRLHVLACDFDVMPIGKTSLKHLNTCFLVIAQLGEGGGALLSWAFPQKSKKYEWNIWLLTNNFSTKSDKKFLSVAASLNWTTLKRKSIFLGELPEGMIWNSHANACWCEFELIKWSV